jgi:hypothetical protein
MPKGVLVPENQSSSDEDGAAEESLDHNKTVFDEEHLDAEELSALRSSADAPKGDYMAILQVRRQ